MSMKRCWITGIVAINFNTTHFWKFGSKGLKRNCGLAEHHHDVVVGSWSNIVGLDAPHVKAELKTLCDVEEQVGPNQLIPSQGIT